MSSLSSHLFSTVATGISILHSARYVMSEAPVLLCLSEDFAFQFESGGQCLFGGRTHLYVLRICGILSFPRSRRQPLAPHSLSSLTRWMSSFFSSLQYTWWYIPGPSFSLSPSIPVISQHRATGAAAKPTSIPSRLHTLTGKATFCSDQRRKGEG